MLHSTLYLSSLPAYRQGHRFLILRASLLVTLRVSLQSRHQPLSLSVTSLQFLVLDLAVANASSVGLSRFAPFLFPTQYRAYRRR